MEKIPENVPVTSQQEKPSHPPVTDRLPPSVNYKAKAMSPIRSLNHPTPDPRQPGGGFVEKTLGWEPRTADE